MWIWPLLSHPLASLFLGRGRAAGRSGLSRRLILGPWPVEPGRQVWLLSVVYGPAPILASSLSVLVCGRGCGAWTRLGSGTLEAVVVLGAALSPSCPQQSCRLQPLGARGSSQTLSHLLIWHLETLGDEQSHLKEERGKSQGCGESTGGSTPLGG